MRDRSVLQRSRQHALVSTNGCPHQLLTLKLQPGKRYRVSYMVKSKMSHRNNRGGAVLNIWDDANRWFPRHNWLTGTADWARQSFEFTAAEGTNREKPATMRVGLVNANGTAWFDDVGLVELGD